MSSSTRSTQSTTSRSAVPSRRGLVVKENSDEPGRVLLTDDEICTDVLAAIPKVHTALRQHALQQTWWQVRSRHREVTRFEMPTTTASIDRLSLTTTPMNGEHHDDLDIAHAMLSHVELRCHINEVISVLLDPHSNAFTGTDRGTRSKSSPDPAQHHHANRMLFRQGREIALPPRATVKHQAPPRAKHVVIGVRQMLLCPTRRSARFRRHKSGQRLAFTCYTHRSSTRDRALHIMKTLPKAVHDQIVLPEDRSALRRAVDHIVAAFDIQSVHQEDDAYGSARHVTRVQAYAYASVVPPSEYGAYDRQRVKDALSPAQLRQYRASVMNPEAHQVLDLLTSSLGTFEAVIQRRRLGMQSFIYFPPVCTAPGSSNGHDKDNYTVATPLATNACGLCGKCFSLFRRDVFCQLCGHMVCGDCSNLCEVEARRGQVRLNRCCVACLVRVNKCMFDDADLFLALGPTVVEANDAAWDMLPSNQHGGADDTLEVTAATPVSALLEQELRDAAHVEPHAFNLASSAKACSTSILLSKVGRTLDSIERHLDQQLRASRGLYRSADRCYVYENHREYAYRFDASLTQSPDTPLAPMPPHEKEATRLRIAQQARVLDRDYDRRVLNQLAQLAANRLGCSMGFVAVIDETHFHAIGSYNFPPRAVRLRRNENICMYSVFAEKPLVVKNPQRDVRFAQMPVVKLLDFRFYAGFPMRTRGGEVLGVFCTGDVAPHHNISTKDYATMQILSQLAADYIVQGIEPEEAE